MRNLGTLYRFELKKLCQRKMVWVSLVIMTAISIFLPADSVIGKMYISSDVTGGEPQVWSHYEIVQSQRTDPAGLDGKPFDTALIQQAISQLGIMRRMTVYSYSDGENNSESSLTVMQSTNTNTDNYSVESYVRQRQFLDVWDLAAAFVGEDGMNEDTTVEQVYDMAARLRDQEYEVWGLSRGERDWWAAQGEKVETPFVWTGYAGGWCTVENSAYIGNNLIMLFSIIALAGLFPMERQRHTDALAACARYGKTPLYCAKLLAGLTASFAGAAVMLGALTASSLILQGPEGFHAAVQQFGALTGQMPMTVGKAALVSLGLYLIASLFYAALVMAVSLLTKGSAAAMAVGFGYMLVCIMVPAMPLSRPLLSRIWSLLPGIFGYDGLTADPRLVHLGGYLTNFQAAPLLWLALTMALAGLGLALHRRVPNK